METSKQVQSRFFNVAKPTSRHVLMQIRHKKEEEFESIPGSMPQEQLDH